MLSALVQVVALASIVYGLGLWLGSPAWFIAAGVGLLIIGEAIDRRPKT
jgi:hypothetical protein